MTMLGTYKTIRERSFRIGSWITFTLPVGSGVQITQVDKEHSKVLVNFNDEYCDWMHELILNDLELVTAGIQIDWVKRNE